jgi:FixJ family two-component response regulator
MISFSMGLLLDWCLASFISSSKAVISIIDDDEKFRAATTDLMRAMDFMVEAFPSAAECLASPHVHRACCLIVDVQMPRTSGTELHSHLLESGYAIPTILVMPYPEDSVRARSWHRWTKGSSFGT